MPSVMISISVDSGDTFDILVAGYFLSELDLLADQDENMALADP